LSLLLMLGFFASLILIFLSPIVLCIFLMWQGGWWAILGLALWIIFNVVGKKIT
jgi:hypothetical protein